MTGTEGKMSGKITASAIFLLGLLVTSSHAFSSVNLASRAQPIHSSKLFLAQENKVNEAAVVDDESTIDKVTLTAEEIEEIASSPIFVDSDTSTKTTMSPETMIQIAKRFLLSSNGIGGNADLLSEDFIFEGPVVGPFGKKQFIDALSNVDFDAGFPDWNPEFYGFHVDPFDNRVWYTARGKGTNAGPFPTSDLPATYKQVINPPQVCSLTIDPSTGLVKRYTIGYVVDRNVGNTGGLGGLYGILYAIGRPLPFPEALPWKKSIQYAAFQAIGGLVNKLRG